MTSDASITTGVDLVPPALVSFPKSGRTWLRYMLTELGARFELTHAGAGHRKERAFAELRPFLDDLLDRRIVFMFRDPRDTAVSGFFQTSKRLGIFSDDISAFLRDPRFGLEKTLQFNLLWMGKAACFRSFLAVSYEALHQATVTELTRIARYIGRVEPDAQKIRESVHAARFENMRALEMSGAGGELFGKALQPGDRTDPNSFKTRQGIVGGWREVLSLSDAHFCEEMLCRYAYQAKVRNLVDSLDNS